MIGRIQGRMAVFLGLLIALGGGLALLSDGNVEALTPGWQPIFQEFSMPITIGEILFGIGLVYGGTRRASGAILSLILFAAWCLTLYFVFIPVNAVTVTKGEIPAEIAQWKLMAHGQWESAQSRPQLQILAGEPHRMRIHITSTTSERTPWHIQLNRSGVALEKDQEYLLRFRARADGVRPVNAAVGRAYGDYGSLGLYQEITVTENWQQFEIAFKATAGDSNARINFDLGHDAHDVELASVTLARRISGAEPPLATVWQLILHAPQNAPGRLEFPATPAQSLRVRILKAAPGPDSKRQPWDIQLCRAGISVEVRKFYLLRFRIRASGVRPVNVAVGRNHGDYGILGLYQTITAAKDWEQFQIAFQATDSESNARIFFDVGQESQDVEIAAVAFSRSDAAPPAPQKLEGTAKETNASGEIIAGDAGPADVDGAPQDAISQRIIWLQTVSKPLWILILLWCSGWFSRRVHRVH